MKFYAVFKGRKQGVFKTWADCQQQVSKFQGCRFKSFSTHAEAEYFAKYGKENKDDIRNELPVLVNPSTSNSNNSGSRKRKRVDTGEKSGLKRIKSSSDIKPETEKEVEVNNIKFTVDDEDRLIVYTDGACSKNGRETSTAGFGVWWGEKHELNCSKKLLGVQTNQRAEIAAVNHAIIQSKNKNLSKITIRTDSMFVIQCLTEWCKRWQKNGWLTSKREPVIHKKELSQILTNMKSVDVKLEHVLGHCGIYGNEMADKLAVQGINL